MSTSSESSFEEQEEFTVANVAVLNKYKLAGELANSELGPRFVCSHSQLYQMRSIVGGLELQRL
jgi:hypothetical protein